MPTTSRRPTRPLSLVVAVALLAVAACSTGGGGDDRSEGAADGAAIAGLLALVPDTSQSREIIMVTRWDLVEAAVDGPADGSPEGADPLDAEIERIGRLTRGGPDDGGAFAGELTRPNRVELLGALGFVPSDVRAEITTGHPPGVLSVVVGEFEPAAVLEAAEQVDGATRSTQGDLEVVRWLEDNAIDLEGGLETPVGNLPGAAGRVAVADGLVAHARGDGVVDGLVAARAGTVATLAEVEPLRRAADALDQADVYSAGLSVGEAPTPVVDPSSLPADRPTLAPYEAYAVGGAIADEGPELVVVLVHADEDGATENRDRLTTVVEEGTTERGIAWTDLLDDPRITQQDSVVVGRFRVEVAARWLDVFHQGSLLTVG